VTAQLIISGIAHLPDADGVKMDIPYKFEKIGIGVCQDRLEPFLEKVT
jgi:hypothetical protein